ncbi:MAG: SGNH/GDSL hydrolase family protein [Thiohalocapsa sp.]|nr:SGNH/GDSL hydrolase family protein [Thiohalocapsa sp.]
MRALLLFSAALLVALLLGEGMLRLLGQSYYWAVSKEADPRLGWRPASRVSAWQRLEGKAFVETNALGFRDIEHAVGKPPESLRIAVLGDSFTEAVQVPFEQTWWQTMARRIEAGCSERGAEPAPRPRPEVLNFAVSGYSPAQSLRAFRDKALRFSPDIAVLVLFIGNDIAEGSPQLDDEPMRPYLRLQDGKPVWDDGFLDSQAYRFKASPAGRALDRLKRHSRIAQTVVQAHHRIQIRRGSGSRNGIDTGIDTGINRRPDVLSEPGVDNGIYRVPADDAWSAAWAATEAVLSAFAEDARDSGVEPLLMIAGTGAQVHPSAAASAAFARRIGVPDLAYPVQRLLRAADAADLPAVNLPAIMATEAERTRTLLHGFDNAMPGFGHWNTAGHRVAGYAAAAALCARVRSRGSR